VNYGFFQCFSIYLNSILFSRLYLKKKKIILISCCKLQVNRVSPSWLEFFYRRFFFHFFFQFYHLKLGYWVLSFVVFFAFHFMRYLNIIYHMFVKLTWIDSCYHRLYIFFFMLNKINSTHCVVRVKKSSLNYFPTTFFLLYNWNMCMLACVFHS
jgi:hypothetical protein